MENVYKTCTQNLFNLLSSISSFFLVFNRLFDLTQSLNSKIRMQALRLLVNLSTNEEMVPHLLAAKVSTKFSSAFEVNMLYFQLL